jgi:2'-5' RNA ligase
MEIQKFEKFMESKSGKLYKYGCVLMPLDIPNWNEILNSIDYSDVYEPEDPTKGCEKHPHVTVKFGLHAEVKDEDIERVIQSINTNFDINIVGIDIFEQDEMDVLKMKIDSKYLMDLNRRLSELPNTSDFEYNPHITIAFLKPGKAWKYTDPNFKMKISKVSTIQYTKPNGQRYIYNEI